MKLRNVLSISSAVATLLVAAAPSASYADSAMDACIEAFVAERVPKDRALKIRKYRSPGSFASVPAGRILLSAKGAKSGTQLAAATCVVDGSKVSLQDASEPAKIASASR